MKNFYIPICLIIVFSIAASPALLEAEVHHSVGFSRHDMNFSERTAEDSVSYTRVSLDELQVTDEIGAPELPVYYFKLIIPSHQDVKEIVINEATEEEIAGSYLIFPAQPPRPTCIDCKPTEFVRPDQRFYGSDEPYPAKKVKLIRHGYFDGSNHIVTLAAYPLQYYPESGRLKFISSIDFSLELKPSSKTPLRVHRRSQRSQSVYDAALIDLVENDHDIAAYRVLPERIVADHMRSEEKNPIIDYIIITTGALKSYFRPIENWRETTGLTAIRVSIDDVVAAYPDGDDMGTYPINDRAGSVRAYLKHKYLDGATWVLIAGPYPDIPFRYGFGVYFAKDRMASNIPTDLYLAEFDGDWNRDGDDKYGEPYDEESGEGDMPQFEQELYIGRIITSDDPQDVVNWRRKLLIYEQLPGYEDPSYLLRSFMTQSDQMQRSGEAEYVVERLPQKIVNDTWGESPGYDGIPDRPLAAEVIKHMNETPNGLYGWFGHGNTRDGGSGAVTMSDNIPGESPPGRFWALNAEDGCEIQGYPAEMTESYDGLDNLENYHYPAILYSTSCDNTPYDRTKADGNQGARNCGEGFTVNTEGGGVAFLGNTKSGFYGNWEPGESALLFGHFVTRINEGIFRLGMAEALSQQEELGTGDQYIAYSHNLIGCPYMEMWTDIPSKLVVSHPIQVPTLIKADRGFDVTVTNEDGAPVIGATVCVTGHGLSEGIGEVGETLGPNGVFTVENIPSNAEGYITIAVTMHDYIPYVGYAKLCGGDDDLLIKDCWGDDGRMPSWDANHNGKWDNIPPDRANWISPWIKVDIGCDGEPPDGEPGGENEQNPKRGCTNHFYVWVKNIGSADALDVKVKVYWADYQVGTPHWPEDFENGDPDHEIGEFTIDRLEWGDIDKGYVVWNVEDWDKIPEHTCIWAFASCPTDPIPLADVNDPSDDNNIGWKNFWIAYSDDDKGGLTRSQASTNIAVVNYDDSVEHSITVHAQSEDFPSGWDAVLTSTDPLFPFTSVDCSRYGTDTRLSCQYEWAPFAPDERRNVELVVQIPPSALPDTATINVYGLMTDDTLAESPVGGVTYQVIHAPSTPVIRIEKTHNSYQGHYEYVSITVENSDYGMGGFDFLIAYDASALAFIEATPGQLLEDCGWEYFTYRYGADGNCGDACPSGLLRIVAMAETDNGPNHPSCFGPPDTEPHELAEMKFFVTNDRTFDCQYVPIRFFWTDCTDNVISSVTGDTLLVSEHVFEYDGADITDSSYGFPTYFGVQSECLEGGGPDKPAPVPFINFVGGGIDIICSDSIDVRGDINVNDIGNEIADAVMFTNYFINGLSAFGDHVEASIAASDVNADGTVLSVADLVYLVRIITGDALPYPKMLPYAAPASAGTLINHSAAAVSINSSSDIGAGYFVFNHSGIEIGEPQLINGASEMTMKYSNIGNILKVLVYSMEKGAKISAGAGSIIAVPITGEGTIELTDVQLSDYYGNLLEVSVDKQAALPERYALNQNYPNPFNEATIIIYELPIASRVTIEIFNVLGQKVTTLLDGQESAGVHSLSWNSTDDSGHPVASGVYFYRISTPNFTAEKKMVLMK